MRNIDIPTLRSLLIYLAYTLAAAGLTALWPVFSRAGARRSDPSAGAALFSVFAVLGGAAAAHLSGSLSHLLALPASDLVNLALAGLVTAFLWLCLYTALTGGLCTRVFAAVNLSFLAVLLIDSLLSRTLPGLWSLCAAVVVLLGTVLILSRRQGMKGQVWFVYAMLAMLASAGLSLLKARGFSAAVDGALFGFGRSAVACVLLWAFVLVRGRQKKLKDMTAAGRICTPLAGLALSGVWVLETLRAAGQAHDWSRYAPVSAGWFLLMVLFSRWFLKEKLPGASVFGALLVTAGTVGILMGI